MISVAMEAASRWKIEAGPLVTLRRLLMPVAAAMRGGTLNKIEVSREAETRRSMAVMRRGALNKRILCAHSAPAG